MSFASIANNPLLHPKRILKVIKEIDISPSNFRLMNEIPMIETDMSEITYDVRKGMGGMTQAARAGAESPTVAFRGASQVTFQPAEWREKILLNEKDLKYIRKLGTIGDIEKASEVVTRNLADLKLRLETRLESLRWKCLFGSLQYQQSDIEYNVDYKIPADFRPTLTGTDLWTDSASDPMADILEWSAKYREIGPEIDKYQFNQEMIRLLLFNSKIRTLRDSLFTGQPNKGMLTPENLRMIFNHFAGREYDVYDGGYFEITDLTAVLASSGTVMHVRDVGSVVAGDAVTIIDVAGRTVGSERCTIASVNVLAKTITLSSPGVARAYPTGSTVRVKKFFIPDDKFIIRGRLPTNAEGGSNWAEVIATTHVYGPGGLMSPDTGVFAKVLMVDEDPPSMQIIVGVNALPVMYHHDVNLIATVK